MVDCRVQTGVGGLQHLDQFTVTSGVHLLHSNLGAAHDIRYCPSLGEIMVGDDDFIDARMAG